MATHSSVLAWRIPGTGEPGGLPSMGLHRVGHDWSDFAAAVLSYEGFPGGASGKEPACQCRRQEMWVQSLSGDYPLEEGMATHSSILAWRIIRFTRGAWWATLHGITKDQTRLSDWHFFTFEYTHTHTHTHTATLVAQTVKSLPTVQETQVWSLSPEGPRRRKWQPTPVFLPGESQGQRSLMGCRLWGCTESDTTEAI